MSICQPNFQNILTQDEKKQRDSVKKDTDICIQKSCKLSCAACCGIMNLQLGEKERKKLLQERTKQVQNFLHDCKIKNSTKIDKVSYFKKAYKYRIEQEKKEEKIIRFDNEIYNCIFLGYLDKEEKQVGCLIHPEQTEILNSQDSSFYGSSICLDYDCRLKDSANANFWSLCFMHILEDRECSWTDYTLLCSDYAFCYYLERLLSSDKLLEIQSDGFRGILFDLIKDIVLCRLNPENVNDKLTILTSFELIELNSLFTENQIIDFLVKYLSASGYEEFWKDKIEFLYNSIIEDKKN